VAQAGRGGATVKQHIANNINQTVKQHIANNCIIAPPSLLAPLTGVVKMSAKKSNVGL